MQLSMVREEDKLGILVFKDSITKEVLIWKHIQSETIKDYKHLLSELINLGYIINSTTIDGKRGLHKAFGGLSCTNVSLSSKAYLAKIHYKAPQATSE